MQVFNRLQREADTFVWRDADERKAIINLAADVVERGVRVSRNGALIHLTADRLASALPDSVDAVLNGFAVYGYAERATQFVSACNLVRCSFDAYLTTFNRAMSAPLYVAAIVVRADAQLESADFERMLADLKARGYIVENDEGLVGITELGRKAALEAL